MPSPNGQCPNWVFTRNVTEEEFWSGEWALPDFSTNENVRYYIYSEEVGESGNYHFQGYVQLHKKQSLAWMKKNLDAKAHWEMQRAKENEDARSYCAKVDDPTFIAGPYEYGTFSKKGGRNDLLMVKKDLDAGATTLDVAEKHFSAWVRYHRSFTLYATLKAPKRITLERVIVLYGPTGTGKTTWAKSEFAGRPMYWARRPNNSAFYFERYAGEKVMLVDEFYGWWPLDFLLRLCLPEEHALPYRGGEYECQATNVIFTSNKTPWTWYKYDMSSFNRRVTDWIYMYWFDDVAMKPLYYQTTSFEKFKEKVVACSYFPTSEDVANKRVFIQNIIDSE